MCRKLIFLISLVLVLGSSAHAGLYVWNGSAGDGIWDTILNWTVTDSAWTWPNEEFGNKMVNDDTLGIDILNGEAVSRGSELAIQGAADGSTTGVLTLDAGSSLTVEGRLAIGGGDNTLGQIDILGGSTLTITGEGNDLKVADNDGTLGTLNIIDSTVDIVDDLAIDQGEGYVNISGSSTLNADDFLIADANTAVCYVDISGTTTVNIVDDFTIDEGIGTVTIGGDAVINFGDDCYIPDQPGAQGTMTLNGNSVFNVGDDMTIADDANTVGHVIVTGNATLNAPDELYLADDPTAFATLDITGNATVNVGDDLDIASDGPAICNIGENATVTVADKIYVGENNEFAPFEGQLTISGNATVEVAGDFAVVDNAGLTGYLHISGNPTIHIGGNFYMNDDASDDPNDPMPSTSEVIMDGGTLTVDGYTTFNDDNPGTAEFIMNGGSFYSAGYLNVSDNLDGTAHLTMNGGEMITGDRLRLGKDDGEDTGQVRIFMNGGLLQAEELSDIMITDTKIIYTGGEIRIRQPFQPDPNDPNTTWGLSKADMQELIDTGIIEVNDVYSIITIGDYTVLNPKSPLIAKVPSPADATIDIAFDVNESKLEWIAGESAVTHKVYLSTDETIDESDLVGETKLTSITVDLAAGTNYYWRVDEVEAYTPEPWETWDLELIGRVEHEGEVWSFTTVHVEAYNPSPSDGATEVSIDAQLSWSPSMDAIMHNVYFGTDKAAVAASDPNDPNTFMGKQMEASFDPGPLELSTTYYWKVDEVCLTETQAGSLWSFSTEEPPPPPPEPEPPFVQLWSFDPVPEDGAENTTQSPVLAFSPGVLAAEHDVYFGDDADAVAEADPNTADIYVGRQAETSYEPGDLEWNKTYYWRVDEVNDAEADSPWKGEVWSLTTADYLIIDDTETTLDYDNSVEPYTTEASWDTPADLTANGVTTDLQFRFLGRPALQDSSSVDEATGIYTVIGAGADIGGTSDQFQYLYRKLKGDGKIIAKVESIQNTDDGAKAGVMIRETLDADSANAMAYITPSGQVGLQSRVAAGKDSERTLSDPNTIAAWVMLVRKGDKFVAQHSLDGETWEDMASVEIVMKEAVYVGLAVTSHSAGVACEAQFSNVSTTGNVDPAAANQDIGIASNSAEQLYLALEDSAGGLGVVTHPNPAATLIDQWWTMKIPLLTFVDAGVDVADATKLYIGVGDVNADVNDVNSIGGTGSIRINSIRAVKPIVILEPVDVTTPDDNVRSVVDAPVADPNAVCTGFQTTPLAGATIVTGLTFTTAEDAAECDPIAFELYGSNAGIDGPYKLIASGDIVDFNEPNEWPRLTKNETPISIDNATLYKHYQVLFTAVRGAESAKIAEFELIGVTEDVLVDITAPGNTIYGYPTDSDWPSSENPLKALDNNIETNYRHNKGESQPTGFVVNPSKKKVVNRLTFTTADDAPERDPVAFELYGSDGHVYTGPWTLIASGKIDDFNQETAWPRQTKNENAIVFDNNVAYKNYKLLFTKVRDAKTADSMQIAEVELIEALD
jgi:regulation of enolase protein 1 (concanavalin A-like superfamily)